MILDETERTYGKKKELTKTMASFLFRFATAQRKRSVNSRVLKKEKKKI